MPSASHLPPAISAAPNVRTVGNACKRLARLSRRVLAVLALFLMVFPLALASVTTPRSGQNIDLITSGTLYLAEDLTFPDSGERLSAWLASKKVVKAVNLLGGAYWFYLELRNDHADNDW